MWEVITISSGLPSSARLFTFKSRAFTWGAIVGDAAKQRYQSLGVDIEEVKARLLKVNNPVSYTHLDVYKRQDLLMATVLFFVGRFFIK